MSTRKKNLKTNKTIKRLERVKDVGLNQVVWYGEELAAQKV